MPQIISELSNQKIDCESGKCVKFIDKRPEIFYEDRPVHDMIQQVLVGIAQFSLDNIYKNSGLTQLFSQEDFKLSLSWKQQDFDFDILFMLFPIVKSSLLQERDAKKTKL